MYLSVFLIMNKTLCYLKWNYIFNILCISQVLMVLIELKSKIKFRIDYIFFSQIKFSNFLYTHQSKK